MEKLALKKVFMKNFKIYDEREFHFDKLTEIYGKNGVGKTSIEDAIKFCMYGSSKDIDKIKVGENEAKVIVTYRDVNNNELVVSASINRETGKYKCKPLLNGKDPKWNAKKLKDLIGYEQFNPQLLLDPKGRTERLLKLLPIVITQDDLNGIEIPKDVTIKWDQHGFNVLEDIQKALMNERAYLYRTKKSKEKGYHEFQRRFDSDIGTFREMYNKELEDVRGSDDIANDLAKTDSLSSLEENLLNAENEWRTLDDELDALVNGKPLMLQKVNDLKQQLKDALDKYEKIDENINLRKEKKEKVTERITVARKKLEENKKSIYNLDAEMQGSKRADVLKRDQRMVDNLRQEMEQSYEDHQKVSDYIKVNLKELKERLLIPVTESIPGLSLSDENQLLLNNKSLDELSQSEKLILGINFIKIKEKDSIVFADGAECIDTENLESLDWGDLTVIIMRVADTPVNKKFTSIHLEKKS